MIPCIRLFVSICLTGILSAQADVRLTLFDCGSITMTDVSAFSLSNEETDVRELFVPCYLIEHPEGRLIWDAGLPLAMAGAGVIDAGNGITLHYETSIVDQLAAQNLGPDDIDLVALSHTHYDHAGAASVFKSATLLIQKPEYQLAFVDKRNDGIFQYDLIKGLEDSEMLMLDGDHDVFGDGSVTIISAPGHTPGHQVLLVRLRNSGPLVLSGDLYHFRESRTLRRAPVFNTDADETFRSMDKVEALIKAEKATFWIEHDQALADSLKKAPAYYD